MKIHKSIALVCFATGVLSLSEDGFFMPSEEVLQELIAKCNFLMFDGPDVTRGRAYNFSVDGLDQLTKSSIYDPNKKTTFYFPGFNEKRTDTSVKTILRAYMKNKMYNFILVDCSGPMSNTNTYPIAVINAVALGRKFGEILYNAIKLKLIKLSNIRLVGHSLGSQFTAQAGQKLIDLGMTLLSIIALDPAGPMNELLSDFVLNKTHLNACHAKMVVILNTDMGFYGNLMSQGTVNVIVNSGTRFQPGCPICEEGNSFFPFVPCIPIVPFLTRSEADRCSHSRSWRIWSEAVACDGKLFIACRCFPEKDCVIIEPEIPETAKGTYKLKTNSESPYGRGFEEDECSFIEFPMGLTRSINVN